MAISFFSIFSPIFFVIAHHPILLVLSVPAVFGLLGYIIHERTGKPWGYFLIIPMFVLGMLNVFCGQWLNAAYLNAVGVRGAAVIVDVQPTNGMLNDRRIMAYDVVLRTADGRDVTTRFDSMSATIWPIRNAILVPPQGETFVAKYVPGFEYNIVIMSDESAYGKRRLMAEARAPVDRALRMVRASPDNQVFQLEYRQALQAFLDQYGDVAQPSVIERYQKALAALRTQ